jgi:hypothetical protein
MCAQTSAAPSESADQEEFVFFLEAIAHYLRVPYLLFYLSITLVIEALRIAVEYVTVVEKMRLSINDLVALWRTNWLIFMWPICMILMYYSMRYLRNYTLYTVKHINPRLKESPTYALEKVFRSRLQHLLPLCLVIISAWYFAHKWFDNVDFTFYSATGAVLTIPTQEIPLKFIHSTFWITYNWIIGGYFSWICLGTIIVAVDASRRVNNIDVFHHDRCGGLSAVGSLAMRTAVLYILSVSFMFPGWIVSLSYAPDIIGLALQIGALSCLVVIELAIFLLPMIFFHSNMSEAKDRQLTSLDAQIVSFRDSLVGNKTSDADNRRFENTITLREIVRSMNEYPFRYGMLARVITSTSIPYLVALAQGAIEHVLHGSA